MAFSSVQFLFVFLPLSLAVYWLCPKWLRNAVLAAFSLLFFAWAGLKGAAILVLLAGINWLGGLSLGRLAHKRPLLILLILLDLAVLGGFKYAGFAAETVNALVPGLLPVLSPALPLGLSFYVFTAIGYCADVAAGKVESEKNPIRFAVFLAFFGHGPSGPIVRYGQQAPQLDPGSETRRVSADRFCYGIKRLVLGLAKKAIIADQLALIYAKVASVPAATLPAPILVLGYTAYMMQLYFDFSGYSDMAIGIGEFFGITLPENFEYPYLACSVGEYWRRWHISLSSWFRDYVYIPLGGSRCRLRRTCLNLLIVFALTGLWHGAAWQYVVFGLAARHNFVHGALGPAPGTGAAAATVPAPVHGGAALADAGDLRCAGPVRGAGRTQGHFYMAERGQGLYAGGLCGHQAAADFSGVLPAVRPRAGAVPQAEGGFVREKDAVPCRDGGAARAAVSGTYARHGRHLQRVYLFSILREVQSYA
uniref:MBOAT family O-acyltransferase n=1 Tax=Gemmiger formicilis TaxID=745368 RepID=UPI0040276F49